MRTPILTRGLPVAAMASVVLATSLAQAADVYVPGVAARLFYDLPGLNNAVVNVTGHPRYPDAPDRLDYVTEFASPQTANPNIENYGLVLKGFVTPQATASYVFYVSGDDNCALYLSTDSNPANKVLIAVEPEWNGVKSWTIADRRPATANINPAQVRPNISVPVSLTANTRYYIEAIVKEGGGGDSLAVGWTQGTAVATDDSEVATLDATVIGTTAPDAPAFVRQPQDMTVVQNRSATLSAYGYGTPANNTAADPTIIVPNYTIQWFQGNTAITDATNFVLTTPLLTTAGTATFKAVLTDGSLTATSRVATVTVSGDSTAPTIASAISAASFANVTVTFDEGMQAGPLGTLGNYTISGAGGALAVTAIQVLDDRSVLLTTARQPGDQQFTLTVANQRDLAGNAMTANTIAFRSFVFKPGLVQYERWNGVTGAFEDARAVVNDRRPDVSSVLTSFFAPAGVADNYLGRLTTYFVPPSNGNYVFYAASDDHGELFLSTNDDPANLKRIAVEPQWNDAGDWSTLDRRNADTPENRSNTYQETEWASGPGGSITLVGGTRYMLQLYFLEGGGGDNGGATYTAEGANAPADQAATALTGSVIGNFVDPLTLPPVITTVPTGTNFTRGDTVTLAAVVESARPITAVQWYRNKRPVAGATSLTLSIPNADVEAVGDYYVDISNVNGTASSYPDDGTRVIMKGAFVVEAEDFNHSGGQTIAAASTQPVAASLYYGLDGLPGIDFHLANQSTADPAGNGNSYRNGYNDTNDPPVAIEFPITPEELGNPDVIIDNGGDNHRRRGDYTATTNYKVGWNSTGEWYNYTRNFPQGRYNVVLAASRDVRDENRILSSLSIVTAGVTTTTQTATVVGTIRNNGTGNWSSLDLIPYRNAEGGLAVAELGANTTVRITNTSVNEDHDIDYLLFYKLPDVGGQITGFRRDGSDLVIDFTGTLNSSDSLNGTYTPVTGSGSVRVPLSGGSNQRFYKAQ